MTPASKLPLEARVHLLECAAIDKERRAREREVRERKKDVEVLRMVRYVRWMCIVAIIWILNLIFAPVIERALITPETTQLEKSDG